MKDGICPHERDSYPVAQNKIRISLNVNKIEKVQSIPECTGFKCVLYRWIF
jgi:hypothetical protein